MYEAGLLPSAGKLCVVLIEFSLHQMEEHWSSRKMASNAFLILEANAKRFGVFDLECFCI
jgi:hypothetical protein